VFYRDMALTTAARAGAQYGARNTTNAQDLAGMQTAAVNGALVDIPTLTTGDITAACERMCEPDAPGSATYSLATPSGGSSCTTGTPTCASGNHLIWVVTVTAAKPFSTLARYPGVPSSLNLSRTAKLRAQ
jgi:hypothetical protein